MELTAKEILVKARNKIAEPENWCKISAAKKKHNQCGNTFTFDGFISCAVEDPEASQWCATGAVNSVIPHGSFYENLVPRRKALRVLDASCPAYTIIDYNDNRHTSHNEILDVFEKAIEIVDTVNIEDLD